MSNVKDFSKQFMNKFKEDNVPLLAAAQAYYYLLSIVPLLIVCFAIVPYLNIDPEDAVAFMGNILPSEIAAIFEDTIVSIVQTPKGGLLTVGIIGSLWSASNAINAFIKSVNQAYDAEETRPFIVVRLIALGLTLGMILALVIAILLPIFGNLIVNMLHSILGMDQAMTVLLHVMRWGISIVVLTLLIMLLYRFAPSKKLPFRSIMPGAIIASVLWQLISFGFSFYVGNFGNYSATYGSLGGLIILMIWFFLTGMIMLIGAIFNAILHKRKQERAAAEDPISSVN